MPVQAATTLAMSSSVTSWLSRRRPAGFSCERLLRRGELLLQLRQAAILDLRGEVQIVAALGLFQLELGLLDLAVDDADGVDGGLLVLPLGLELFGLLLEVGQVLLQLLQPLAGAFVLLLLERALLDLQLLDLPLQLVNLGRHGVQLHAQARGGFVNQVNRLVRQETVGDVAMRERRRRDQRRVLDAHAVVDFVALLEPAQDGDGRLDARLGDKHRLEAPLQRGVFLDVLAILVEGGGADGAQFAAGKLRLHDVRGVGRALPPRPRRRACAAHQ